MQEPSLRRKLAFSFIAIALFLILAIALGEVTVRAMTPKSDPVRLGVKLPGSERLYGLRPNHRSLQTGVMVQTNSLGFRENEYPLLRRAGAQRIVVLGDSYTFGTGVEFGQIYSKRLEAELNRSGKPFEVINFGVPGYNTTLALATLRETAAQFKPDLVIVGYVLNDTERYGDGTREALPGAPSAQAWVHTAHIAVGVTCQILHAFEDDSPGWVESRGALLEIAQESRRIGAATLVVVFPMMVDAYPLQAAHDRITRFCRDHGIEVLDLVSSVAQGKVSDLIVVLDGHPNGRAHKIFADRIYRHLAENPSGLSFPRPL